MRIPYLAIILAALIALSTPTSADKRVDDSAAIKSTITAFLRAMSAVDINKATGYVDNAGSGSPLIFLKDDLTRDRLPQMDIQARRIQSTILGNDATARVTITSATYKKAVVSTIHLRRASGKWIILAPVTPPDFAPEKCISFLAFAIVHPMLFVGAHQEMRTSECTSRMKMAAYSTIEYLMDNNAFPTDLSHFDKDVQPYLRPGQKMFCTEDHRVHFQINQKLAGVSYAQLQKIPRVVLLYEGTKDQMLFPHIFRGLAVLADGSVQLVSEAESANLSWDPAATDKRESLRPRAVTPLSTPVSMQAAAFIPGRKL